MEDNGTELEQMLRDGIATYPGGEPLAGLEDRILARVQLAGSRRRSLAGWWVVSALGIAALSAVSVYWWAEQRERPPVQVVSEVKMATLPAAPVRKETVNAFPRRAARHHQAALPKLPIFPTPSPLTPEERLLLAMVKRDPDAAAQTLDSLRRESAPLEIAPLVIPPLANEGQ